MPIPPIKNVIHMVTVVRKRTQELRPRRGNSSTNPETTVSINTICNKKVKMWISNRNTQSLGYLIFQTCNRPNLLNLPHFDHLLFRAVSAIYTRHRTVALLSGPLVIAKPHLRRGGRVVSVTVSGYAGRRFKSKRAN